ncbi:MAG: ABC transporter substrate-binding protein [Alphaproteobacteria bacterium]|nr:ABC transporter substrate-binding protein [Alphaproteobacteria bacterium]MCZ6511903.1 ABC transporter substrate-binding protein [Alphaproteobacteria bacterium]MCZ6838120.1 ABC transporter substrate-binding protein [Alphaproteobacteria bacterium]
MARSKDRREFVQLSAATAVATAAIISSPAVIRKAWAATPIRVGHLNTFSGAGASLGEQGGWGLKAAVDRINKAGGINGRMIEVIQRDDTFKPATAVREAEKMILQDKIDVLTGVSSSGICVQLAPLMERHQTLFVLGTGCETTNLTGGKVEKCPKHVFRPYNSTKSQAIAMAPWAIANGIKSATALYLDFAWGQSVAFDFADEFKRLGGKWIEPVAAPLSTTDYLPYVSRINQDADALLFGVFGGHAIKSLLAAHDAGVTKNMKFFGPASVSDTNTVEQQGKSAIGGFYLHRYPAVVELKGTPFDDAANHKFRAEVLAQSKGVLPSGFTQAQFTGMNLIKQALTAVKFEDKKADTPRMIEWLEGSGGTTEFGPGRMLKQGDDFPQGDVYLRSTDHQGFTNHYMATVDDNLGFRIVGDRVDMKTTLYPSKFDSC